MKTATITVTSINLCCPYCGQDVYSREGSFLLLADDFQRLRAVLTCEHCGQAMHRPRNPFVRRTTVQGAVRAARAEKTE